MWITAQVCAGQCRGIEQTGVVELVLHADVAFLAQQRLLHGQVGQVRAGEQYGARIAEPVGHFVLQGIVQDMAAARAGGRTAAAAFARGRILQRVDHPELLAQPQIIAAAEGGKPAAIDFQAHAIAAADGTLGGRTRGGDPRRTQGQDSGRQIGTGHGGGMRQGGDKRSKAAG